LMVRDVVPWNTMITSFARSSVSQKEHLRFSAI
jgi:hypothetical protein